MFHLAGEKARDRKAVKTPLNVIIPWSEGDSRPWNWTKKSCLLQYVPLPSGISVPALKKEIKALALIQMISEVYVACYACVCWTRNVILPFRFLEVTLEKLLPMLLRMLVTTLGMTWRRSF